MVIAVIEVIGYRHVLASTDAPEVAVIAHLPHQLLDIVVGFAEGLAHLLRTRRFTQRAKALLDLLPLTGVAILLRIPGDLPGGGGGVPREGKLLLLLYVPPRDVEIASALPLSRFKTNAPSAPPVRPMEPDTWSRGSSAPSLRRWWTIRMATLWSAASSTRGSTAS